MMKPRRDLSSIRDTGHQTDDVGFTHEKAWSAQDPSPVDEHDACHATRLGGARCACYG